MSRPAAKWSTAFNRFGLGARAQDALAAGDPREAVEAELSASGAGRMHDADLPTGVQAFKIYFDFTTAQAERSRQRRCDARRRRSPCPLPMSRRRHRPRRPWR